MYLLPAQRSRRAVSGFFSFSCFGTITSPTPKSILKRRSCVFKYEPAIEAPIPAYFFATAMGAISLIPEGNKIIAGGRGYHFFQYRF